MTADVSLQRLPPIPPDELSDEARSLSDMILAENANGRFPFRIADDDGALIGPFRVFMYDPAVGKAVMPLAFVLNWSERLTERSRHIAMLAAAAAHRTEYEWYAHEILARGSLSQNELDAIRTRVRLQFAAPEEQVTHDISRALLDEGDLDDQLYQRGVDVLGRQTFVELVWLVGMHVMGALQLRVHRLGVPGGVPPPVWA